MDISTTTQVRGYQAVVFAERDAASGDDDCNPSRMDSVVIGTYETYQDAKRACVQALRDVIDYIGFTINTIIEAASLPQAA